MSEQIIHIKTPIGREDLDSVITGLEVACGGNRIIVTEVFDLVVTDERQATALKALFSQNGKTRETGTPTTKKQKKIPKTTKAALGPHSYRFEGGSVVISGQALNKLLAAGDTSLRGTVLINAKGERFCAVEGEIPDGPYRLVNAGKWENAAEKPHRASPKYIPYTFLSGPRINDTITGGALGGMLKAGNVEAGTRMSHPERGQLIVVTNGKGLFTLQAVPA